MPSCPFSEDSEAHALLASTAKKCPLIQSMHMCIHFKTRVKILSICPFVAQHDLSWASTSFAHSNASPDRECAPYHFLSTSAPGTQCPFPTLPSWASHRKAQSEISQGLCCQSVLWGCSHLLQPVLPCLHLLPPEYCIHSAKQVGEREKYDSSLPNKLFFL